MILYVFAVIGVMCVACIAVCLFAIAAFCIMEKKKEEETEG